MESEKENVVFFPFMAQGHIIPFLALALQIEKRGYEVTFVNTPLNIKKLRSSLPPDSAVRLLEIPFNAAEYGLPPGVENTDGLPYPEILRLMMASTCLEAPFRDLLASLIEEKGGAKPLCVVADFFFGWSASVAHEFGIFHAIFTGTGGYGMACYYSMWLGLHHKHTNKSEFILNDFPEARKFHVSQLSPSLLMADEGDPCTEFQRKILPTWMNSDGLLFNTIEEIDENGLLYFKRKLGLPIWGIGPMVSPKEDRSRCGKESKIPTHRCIQWLDEKDQRSVLYISFGSQSTISASQMMQLARALDAGSKSFIWVIRPPLGFVSGAEFMPEAWLPEGFVEHVEREGRGLIVKTWAPQVEILSHEATAAFLSHCGWNSVLESLTNGVPLIGWPMAAEQFFNAKFLVEEVGVCVEVVRGTNFEIRFEDILEKIELLMGENERGWKIRKRASEVREIIEKASRDEEGFKGSSVKAKEEFLNSTCMKKLA